MEQNHGSTFTIEGISYIEIYVSNCQQAAHYYRTALGFTILGQVMDDGGAAQDRASIALQQGDIRVLLTAPLAGASEVAEFISLHGEGIKDIALCVRDVENLLDRATGNGAKVAESPSTRGPSGKLVRHARVGACAGFMHSVVEYPGDFASLFPGLLPERGTVPGPETGLSGIDHIAQAVRTGELDRLVEFYVSALGFLETHRENVSTEYSAMRSKVVQTPNGKVRFPIMEPAAGPGRSQIDAFINSNNGPGVQHLAFRSDDIVRTVSVLADNIEFLSTPNTYYESLEKRVGNLGAELEALRRYGILADRDPSGLLLQVFTKPIGTRPTLFLEVIERRGSEGFGGNNIKALFEAVERAHDKARAFSSAGPPE